MFDLPLRWRQDQPAELLARAPLESVRNAAAMSERIFGSWSPTPLLAMARSNRYGETSVFHQQYLLAGDLRQCEIAPYQHRVVAVRTIADDDGRSIDARGGRHVERRHVGHDAGLSAHFRRIPDLFR